MHDIVFYTKSSVAESKKDALLKNYPFAKIVEYSNSITETAINANVNIRTKFFWLIEATNNFLDSMLEFEPSKWDVDYIHVFKLQKEFSKHTECFLIPTTCNIDKSSEYFANVKYIDQYSLPDKTYDIFFLSYNEPNSWSNWQILSKRFPHAKRIEGVANIYLSHKLASEQSATDYFWVVDADNEVLDTFDFSYFVEDYDFDIVHIWHSRNEINDLEYGNGAIKLFPKVVFDTSENGVDITTSLGNKIKIIPEVASINRFASSPWNAWRSAFRECVKLASNTIKRSNKEENQKRLNAWNTKGLDKKFGEYAVPGARAGTKYGIENKENQDALSLINNWDWLYDQFIKEIKLPYRPK